MEESSTNLPISPSQTTLPSLSAHDTALLMDGSAIAPALIRARGYRTATDPEDLGILGFSKTQARLAPALLIPLWDVHGEQYLCQMRPHAPRSLRDGDDTKPAKYELPTNSTVRLDVHPSCRAALGNPAMPLWLTEGVRKGDSLLAAGAACVISFATGVWGWRGKNAHGGKVILPDWDFVALNGRTVHVAFDSDLSTKRNVQQALRGLYGFLRAKGAIPSRVDWPEAYTEQKWGVDDFFASGKTLSELEAMIPRVGLLPTHPSSRTGTTPASQSPDDGLLPWSDYTNARAFVQDHGTNLRYCFPWKSWLVWSGTHWQRDTTGTVMLWAKTTVKKLARQMEQLDDEKKISALMAHIKSSLSTSKLKALVESAQSEPGVSIQPEAIETDSWLLNCANGTLDLRTGELRPHAPEDLITKCLPFAYHADAECPTWDAFLWRIMGGSAPEDEEDMPVGMLAQRQLADERATSLVAYLQRSAGYTLTGSTQEQCLFLCYGPTKTGKSTYLATLRALTGSYGKQADIQTFMHKDRPEVRNDLADLAGARYVYAVESQEGKRLAENLIKQMTGGVDAIKARFLFEEYFEFKPQFKVYIGTNYLPRIKNADDDAIWERIRIIPFTIQIPTEERDKGLEDKLIAELPGILAWAMRGCLAWRDGHDLKEPAAVVAATAEYRVDMDSIARFLDDCCVEGPVGVAKVKATTLMGAYQAWCKHTNEFPLSNLAFIDTLTKRGYARKTGHANQKYWHGLGLANIEDERYN